MTNQYRIYLDAVVNDTSDELDVQGWSPTAVSEARVLTNIIRELYS